MESLNKTTKNAVGKNTRNESKPFYLKAILTILYIFCPVLWLSAFFGIPLYGKYFKNKVTSVFNSYILPPLATIAVFLIMFAMNDVYPFGNKTIAWCDMTQQGVPYWINFKQVLQGEHDLFLNMANAAGMDGWSFLRSYFIYPFSYLILLVDSVDVMAFVSLATVLKLSVCTLTAMVFFRVCVKKLNPSIAVALSMMYSFCAYGTMYYQIINWPTAMYMMPLYFTGLYLLLKEHKIWLFSVSIALIMRNFSFGYMAVIATILFVGYYLIVCEDRFAAKKNAFNFTVGSLFGAILSMPIWLPFFGAFNNSARGVNVSGALSGSVFFTSKNTVYPLLMSTAIIFVAAFVFKAVKKKPIEKALYFLFGIMLIPMVFEPINKMWHFGSYTGFPARYAYIIVFAGLAIAGILLSKDIFTKKGFFINDLQVPWQKITVYSCTAFLLVCFSVVLYIFNIGFVTENINAMDAYATTLWGDSSSYKHMLVLFSIFVLAYGIFYAAYKRKLITKQLLAMFLVVVLVCEAYVSISTYIIPATTKVNMENYEQYMDLTDRIDDDDFYRVKNNSFLNSTYGSASEANFPGSLGYNSMGHYSSLTSESYLYAAKAYGYSSVWMKVDTYGGTKFSDALFSIKYNIDKTSNLPDDVVYSNDKYCIVKNEFYLPLGLFTDNVNIDIDLEEYTRIGLQEYVFKSLADTDKDLFTYLEPTTLYGCSIESEDGEYVIKKSNEGAFIEYTVQVNGTQTLYFDCFDEFSNALSEKINKSFSVYVNGIKKHSQYPIDKQNGLLNLGTFSDETITVQINVLKDVSCRSFGLFAMDDKLLYNEIGNIKTADLKVEGNKITGNFKSEDDGYIFVSVPYKNGFSCKVNGKQVEVKNCFGGFIGIPVAEGTNSIVLKYTPSMFYPSILTWVVSLIVLLVLIIILRKKGMNSAYDVAERVLGKKGINVLSIILLVCCIIAFVAMIILIYIVPMLLALIN